MSDTFTLKLPDAPKGIEGLLRLHPESKDRFIRALANQLWVEHESLSDEVKHIIRGALAASYFENNPETQERRLMALHHHHQGQHIVVSSSCIHCDSGCECGPECDAAEPTKEG